MRLGELVGKEVVNLHDGARLGVIGETDICFDAETGQLQSIILPQRQNFFTLWFDRQELVIPWEAVKKIGVEVVVVDLDRTYPRLR
ncbi:sporulation protein, YlmC/YmxH family [Ammonifex degensii KC4]|uniref:Sporulation protein, YlmC/YmxH family n=1 Tax=Ammonifex degensii (strain DSM 10501 / KC4) TaxID=429009 RepID=C9R8W4_AMMDK|nr:YlmC/YmxH family sporulation protein [Ammonifex degensii]ACX52743.1 sporulation protein, YlmC/YmxH family [Ammonifex degensii KC4]